MPTPIRAAPADLDLSIRDYLARQPQAVGVLLDLRMGCLGCDFSAFDTLRQALGAHGIPVHRYLERLARSPQQATAEFPPSSFPGEDT